MAVVVHRLVPQDLALPAWRYVELFAGDPWRALLDSARDPDSLGRYTFVAGEPFLVYQARRVPGGGPGSHAVVREWSPGEGWRERRAEPLSDLRATLAAHGVPPGTYSGEPLPFRAGAVGWIGYDAGHFVEALPDRASDDLGLPDVCLMFVDLVLVADQLTGRTMVSVLGRGLDRAHAEGQLEARLAHFCQRLRAFEASAPPAWTGPTDDDAPRTVELRRGLDREAYLRVVERAREHIEAGDVFEVCTSHRLDAPYPHSPWALYAELRRINPAPFAAFIDTPEAAVVSASPERFLRLDSNGRLESRPIKGTRPRGSTPESDRALAEALATSPKDRAENVMIVDLVRSDLGRVARIGSVEVAELMAVESYATVHQLVSTVRAVLDRTHDAIDAIAACFPGGSMTGAPKVEAMKIIDQLEPVKRGVYAGAIGYLDFAGNFDLSIVIRTVVVKDGRAHLNVGGAVVADSAPAAEHDETLDKARALVRALEGVERVMRR